MNPNDNPHNFKNLTYFELDRVATNFHEYPWEQKSAYADFISNMFNIVSQACRLLTAAASRCDLSQDLIHQRLVTHAHEERNHEKLITHDLKALAIPMSKALFSTPPIWQTQYYLIEHISPMSLFGYILYFENLSFYQDIGQKVYARCLDAHGREATSYLRVHVEEDPDHVEKLFKYIGQMSEHELPNILQSLQLTSSLFQNFLRELAFHHTSVARSA